MKALNWNDITVQQFMDIDKLTSEEGLDDFDKAERVVSVMYDMTEQQIGDLPMTEFNRMAKECGFLINGKLEGKPQKVIKCANGKKYAIMYEVTKIKQRQYAEINFFSQDNVMANLHLIMASIVQPVDKFGFKKKNKAEEHEMYANDLLQARIADVYYSCVFFCKLFVNLMQAIKGSLIAELMTKEKITRDQAITLFDTSINAMDGFITQSKSPTFLTSRLTKLGKLE